MEDKRKEYIENTAWNIFQKRLNISFKRPLTPEEKQQVIDADPENYQRYREEAIKMWEKSQRALSNKKYPVIDVPASGKPGWMGGAYTLCFVYSKYDGNFVLRGYMKEVEEYLKKNYTHYFCNKSLWSGGFHRDIWEFWKDSVLISAPHRDSKTFKGDDKWKWNIREYVSWYDRDDETEEEKRERESKQMYLKRMPHRWIPEFDKF